MTPTDIQLIKSLAIADKDKLVETGAFTSTRNGIPFTDDDPLTDPREGAITAITARCEVFSLNDEVQRKRYADIMSKIYSDDPVDLLWEERVESQAGLVVYLTFIEYSQITKKTIGLLSK